MGANVSTGTIADTAVLDLHNLNSFTFNGGATGEVRIGGGNVTGTGNRANGTLILSNTSNSINAGTMTVGGGADASGTAGAAIVLLGTGTNVLDVDNLFISTWKTNGAMSFIGATGSLKIRDRTDAGRAAVTLGSSEGLTANSGTHTGTLTAFSHNLDIAGQHIDARKAQLWHDEFQWHSEFRQRHRRHYRIGDGHEHRQ